MIELLAFPFEMSLQKMDKLYIQELCSALSGHTCKVSLHPVSQLDRIHIIFALIEDVGIKIQVVRALNILDISKWSMLCYLQKLPLKFMRNKCHGQKEIPHRAVKFDASGEGGSTF